MPRLIACAVVRDDPPRVFVAEDQDTLNWILALRLIAQMPGRDLPSHLRDALRTALRDERWADAVELWMHNGTEVDVYPSFEFYMASDVELAAQELDFTPLFRDQ
jgi:hypothetical protein